MILEGIIQGLTEFLPVSSSGHLALLKAIFKEGSITTTVIFHLATLLAVIFFLRQEIVKIFNGLVRGVSDPAFKTFCNLVIATVPAMVVGVSIAEIIEKIFSSYRLTLGLLILNGSFILGTVWRRSQERRIGPVEAIVIGVYQAIAILPGISRSGATIGIALYLGVKPIEAFRFSFLLSIPVIIGAGVLEINGITKAFSTCWDGFLISFFSGIVSLYILRRLVVSKLFYLFGIYCIVIGWAGLIFF